MKWNSSGTWQFNIVFGLLILALPALAGRYAQLMRDVRSKAMTMTERQEKVVAAIPARPGNILAQTYGRYVLMAGSRQVPSVFADPGSMTDPNVIGKVVPLASAALNLDPRSLQETLFSRENLRFTRIKNNISQPEYDAFTRLRLPGMGIVYDWQREYPNGSLASAVLGFRQPNGVGGGGLEQSLDRYLMAHNGKRTALSDARRRAVWPVPEQSRQPRDGKNVYLCLDLVIQGFLEKAVNDSIEKFGGKNTWGTGVVANPNTGEILAMYSYPTFDPKDFSRVDPNARANRAISMPYEPGSAFKSIIAAAAIESGVVTPETQIFCENGSYTAPNGGTVTDHGAHYGNMSVSDVVVFSSNVGMAKIGEKLGNTALNEIVHRFGFGQKTCVELSGESPGIIRPLRHWDGYSLRRVPFGQEISVTALQLTMAYCALVNGGELLQPRLIDRITDVDGNEVYRGDRIVVRRGLVSRKTTEAMLQAMQGVVERGTAKSARSRMYTIFGKTGTAQISGGRAGYLDGAFTATFVGGAPVSKPEVIVLISIYWPDRSKGHFGGTVSAPYVKEVIEKTLTYWGVPKDRKDNFALTGKDDPKAPKTSTGW